MGVSEIRRKLDRCPHNSAEKFSSAPGKCLIRRFPKVSGQGMREIAGGEVMELNEALEELEQPK